MDSTLNPELIDHLSRTTGLSRGMCTRIALDVLAEFDESVEAFVKRRHKELQATTDLKNEQIYLQIQAEIPTRRFASDELSKRQIRRLIYG